MHKLHIGIVLISRNVWEPMGVRKHRKVAAAHVVSELNRQSTAQCRAALQAVQSDTAQNSKIQHSTGRQGSDVWYSTEAMYCVYDVWYVESGWGEHQGTELNSGGSV